MRKAFLILLAILAAAVLVFLTNETIVHYRLINEKMNRIEYAIDASISGVHGRLDSIETKVYSYEDAMEAIALVLERNSGYFLYQELGVVVMSHDEYLRRGGD